MKVLPGVNGDTTTGASHISIAENGTLAYTPGSALAAANRLVWVDRKGVTQPLESPQGLYFDPQLSPDGTRVAVVWQTLTAGWATSGSAICRARRLRASRSAATRNSPVWSADGKTIYYAYLDPNGRQDDDHAQAGRRQSRRRIHCRARDACVSEGGHAGRRVRDHRLRQPRTAGGRATWRNCRSSPTPSRSASWRRHSTICRCLVTRRTMAGVPVRRERTKLRSTCATCPVPEAAGRSRRLAARSRGGRPTVASSSTGTRRR